MCLFKHNILWYPSACIKKQSSKLCYRQRIFLSCFQLRIINICVFVHNANFCAIGSIKMWNFLNNFLLGFFSQTVNIFLQTYKMVFSCWYASGFVYGSVDNTAKLVFYQGPPCVVPHSPCSSTKHLPQCHPFTTALLSLCVFLYKHKSFPFQSQVATWSLERHSEDI